MSSVKIIETKDGSHSLLNEALNETYHSTHGAVQESVHVFIKNGLYHWLQENQTREISILEVGFGTGLNALLALRESRLQNITIHYTTLEAFPLGSDIVNQLNYPHQILWDEAEKLFHQLHASGWEKPIDITPDFLLEKKEGRIQDMSLAENQYDVIFFDAFAPAKQPEMWELPVLEKVVNALRRGGLFVTYCAQGQLKRNLKSLGLKVETLPGPPGKREMVRASK